VGTPEYIAPEQIRSTSATALSDLYSLGCVLFEMLTGHIPFEGKTTVLLVKHINDPPPVPSSLNPAIPPEIDRLILRLLQKKAEDRHRDAYHLIEDLQRLLDTLPGSSSRSNLAPRSTSATDIPVQLQVQPEEEGWARTARLYRQLFVEAHAAADAPGWLPGAISAIEAAVVDIRELRARLEETAAKATEQQEEVRKPREQIGHALDELAKDDSRVGGQITDLQRQLEPAESRLDAALHAVLSGIGGAPKRLRPRELVTEEDATELKDLVRAGGELALSRDVVSGLRSSLTRKEAERRDLRFQMAQLKQKLEQLNQSSTMDMEIWHEETHALSSEIQARLESIAPLAKRISAHFAGYPQLRDRLARDHAPITLSEPI
jgi:eukaryotic-like serine/threonine-protein kinase